MPARKLVGAAIICAVVVGVGVGIANGDRTETGNAGLREGDTRAADTRPASPAAVVAKTRTPSGYEIGVATYRNESGILCLAQGPLRADGRQLEAAERGASIEELANCTLRPQPIAATVTRLGDDPTTAGNERATVVTGLADEHVAALTLGLPGGAKAPVRLASNGAFIVVVSDTADAITATITRDDGSAQNIELPVPLDPVTLSREAEAQRDRSAEIARDADAHAGAAPIEDAK